MRKLALIFMLTLSTFAQADEVGELLAQLNGSTKRVQANLAVKFCKEKMSLHPGAGYREAILSLGNYWHTQPDMAHLVLTNCQTLWIRTKFQPVRERMRVTPVENAFQAFTLPLRNFIRKAEYLREEIQLFSRLNSANNPALPPSPFEILYAMASSKRQLEESMHREMVEAWKGLSVLGTTVTTHSLYAFSKGARATVKTVGLAARAWAYGLAIEIAISGAAEVGDAYAWKIRHQNLRQQLNNLEAKLASQTEPDALLVDEYYQAAKNLGHFLSYSIYLKQTQQVTSIPTLSPQCREPFRAYFQTRETRPEIQLNEFTDSNRCRDAVAVWIETAEKLRKRFLGQSAIEDVADRLMENAILAFIGYEEAWAYEETFPKCTGTMFYGVPLNQNCTNAETGGQTL